MNVADRIFVAYVYIADEKLLHNMCTLHSPAVIRKTAEQNAAAAYTPHAGCDALK